MPVPSPSTSDIFIPILGVTGVGKSTFINDAAGKVVAPINDGLTPHADPIKTIIVAHPHDTTRRITFVDTPGFDDTSISDEEILKRIVDWLESSDSAGIKLAGVIYLHDITRTRLHETYNMLAHRLAAHNFVLATTKWNQPEKDAERRRERQLSEKFWKGSNLPRFMHTTESAWAIIDLILQMPPLETPQFRKTLSDFQRRPQKVHATPSGYLSRFLRRLFD